MRRSAEKSNSLASSGPPKCVPAKGLLLLIEPDDGRACWVTLYENEETCTRETGPSTKGPRPATAWVDAPQWRCTRSP